MRTLSRFITVVSACLPLLFVAGCGDPLNRGGEISGTVTIDDEPVTAGNVLLVSEDGKWSVVGPISATGTYTVKEPPLGTVRIAVQTEMYSQKNNPDPGHKTGKGNEPPGSRGMVTPNPAERGLIYKAIPAKYEKIETSDLSVTVTRGNQQHDIRLTSK
jgi:hypothetical protein